MNELWNAWAGVLAGSGLALLLQTSLLLGPGAWALRQMQRRRSGAQGLMGRALLVAVLAGTLLSLGWRGRVALWNVPLPEAAPVAFVPASSPIIKLPSAERFVAASEVERFADKTNAGAPQAKVEALSATALDESPAQPAATRKAATGSNWLRLAAGAWLFGSLALLAWLGLCHLLLWRLRRGSRAVTDAAMLASLAQSCAMLGVRAPRLLRHGAAGSPFLTGLWRPAIVLPQGETWDEPMLRAVLLHEAAHLKRRDLWWNALGRIGCALLWPQPMLWLLCRRLEQINEAACDEAVLRGGCEPGQYARCLLFWAERLAPRRAERVAGAGVLAGRSSLSRRVQAILDGAPSPSRHVSKRLRWTMMLAVVVAVVATPLLVSSQNVPPPSPSKPVPAAPTGKRMLQHFKETDDYRIYIGGVSNGVLQAVSIWQLRGETVIQIILARTARRQANSGRWVLSDVLVDTFSDANGLESEMRAKRIVLNLSSVSAFLEQQSRAASEPAPTREWAGVQHDMRVSGAELLKLRAWGKGRGRATITGRVVGEDGRPVAGADVEVTLLPLALGRIAGTSRPSIYGYLFALPKTTREVFSQSAKTGRDGSYRIAGLAGAAYSLAIQEYGRNGRFRRNAGPPPQVLASEQRVTPRERGIVAAPNLVLTRGGLLHVRVEDQATGAPLPDVAVIGSVKTGVSAPVYVVETDAAGQSLLRLPVGKARVSIGGQSASGTWNLVAMSQGVPYRISHGGDAALDGNAPRLYRGTMDVQVVKGQTHEVLLRLPRYIAPTPTPTPQHLPSPPGKATLIGRVVDAAGRGVGGIPISAIMQQAAKWKLMQGAGLAFSNSDTPRFEQKWASIDTVLFEHAVTRADGSFVLRGLTTAPYNLIVGTSSRNDFGMRPPSDWVAPAVEGAWAKEGQVVQRARPIVLTRGALIEGRVVDKASGLPLGGVIFGSNGPQLPASTDNVMGAKSDAQGRFSLRVAPGTTTLYIAGPNQRAMEQNIVYADDGKPGNAYRIGTNRGLYAGSGNVQFEINGGPPQFGLNFGTKVDNRISIVARAGQTVGLTLRLRRLVPETETATPAKVARGTALIIGRAVYENGRPAGGVAVVAVAQKQKRLHMGAGHEPGPYLGLTRANGTFRLSGLVPGVYNVMLGRAPREAQSPQAAWTAIAIENVRASTTSTRLARPLTLRRGAILEGEVLDRQSGKPLSGVRVGATGPHRPDSSDGIVYSTTDRGGRYRLRVPSGIISLHAFGPWADHPQSGLRFADTGTEDNSNGVGRFDGNFYDITNWVEVQFDGGKPGYQGRDKRELELVPVRDGQKRHVNFRLRRMIPVQLQPLPPATASLEGRVLLEDGRPAAGVRVVAKMQAKAEQRLKHAVLGTMWSGRFSKKYAGLIFGRTLTRPDGTYRLSGLTNAPYDVLADGETLGRVAPALLGMAAREGQSVRASTITLTPGSTVQGRVVDARSGVPLAGVEVGCYGPHAPLPHYPLTATTNAQGRYTLRVAPGRNLLFVIGGMGLAVTQPVRVGGQTLYLRSCAALRIGRALYPIGNWGVQFFPSQQAMAYERQHPRRETIQAVLDGRQTTSIRAGGGDAAPVQVSAAQTRNLDFRLKKLDAPASAQQLKAPLRRFGSVSPTLFEARSRRHVWQPL